MNRLTIYLFLVCSFLHGCVIADCYSDTGKEKSLCSSPEVAVPKDGEQISGKTAYDIFIKELMKEPGLKEVENLWLIKAVEKEYPIALQAYGYFLERDAKSCKDKKEALTYFKRSFALANADVYFPLKEWYLDSSCNQRDLQQAKNIIKKAAYLGEVTAISDYIKILDENNQKEEKLKWLLVQYFKLSDASDKNKLKASIDELFSDISLDKHSQLIMDSLNLIEKLGCDYEDATYCRVSAKRYLYSQDYIDKNNIKLKK